MLNLNLPTYKVTIGNKEYTLTKLKGWDGMKGWTLIMKLAAPAIGGYIDSRTSEDLFENNTTMTNILATLAENIDKPEVDDLIFKMLDGICTDEGVVQLNTEFQGKPHQLFEIVMKAFEENFKDFFIEGGMLASLTTKANSLLATIKS